MAREWRRLVLAAALVLSSASAVQATTTGMAPGPAVGLADVRFGGDAAATRVVLDLDGAVAAKLAPDADPGRIVVVLPAILSSGPLRGAGQGLVKTWSLSNDAGGALLTLAVAPGATAVRRFLIPPTAIGGRWRYVIDIRGADRDDDPLADLAMTGAAALDRPSPAPFSPAPSVPTMATFAQSAPAVSTPPLVRADSPSRPAAPRVRLASRAASVRSSSTRNLPARNLPARNLKVIVIDAGHGGQDPGARSLVRNEKDITLAAALSLRTHLLRMGRYRVVLTRDSDVFVPLETRVQIARRAGADLFISLHADSGGTDPTPHGASVYTLSDHGETRVNTVLGPHEWFAGAGDRRTEPGVRQILLDLTQTSTRNRSSQFASILLQRIGDRVDLLPRSHRDAGYFVLLAPDVPAVLLEMGFITNPADEMRLTDPAQRDKLMDAVADAIDAYFTGGPRLASG